MSRRAAIGLLVLVWIAPGPILACSGGESAPIAAPAPAAGSQASPPTPASPPSPTSPPTAAPEATALPPELPNGLLIATSQFAIENGQVTARPGPARLDILTRSGGEWRTQTIEDPGSNVFHKAMVYRPVTGAPGILTLGAMGAAVKLWRPGPNGQWASEAIWTERFGGRFDRMRDAEIADLYGDGPTIAIATHDQGVVALVRADRTVTRIDQQPNTFVHEIEIGDLDADGALEVYATPSEPNDLSAGAVQHGQVVRYVPRTGEGRTMVAELGNRHAKEILVGDVDGDGRDELYVAVEALTSEGGQIQEPVQIRRYDHGTAPNAGVVIATIPNERLTRFLSVGDVDGDGRREMVIATFSQGLWLARPGRDPRGEWSTESIDRDSGGFEHSVLLADLDGDRRDELYVASDTQGELRRYVWINGRARSEVILRREVPRAIMTWNLVAFPISILAPATP